MWFLCVSITLLAYPLSPAPVAKTLEAIYGSPVPRHISHRFDAVYSPILKAHARFRPVRDFYRWYFRLWGL